MSHVTHARPRVGAAEAPRHVVIRTDSSPTIGVGHLLRSLALAEELHARGHRVSLIADLADMAWPRDRALAGGLVPIAPADLTDGAAGLVAQAESLGADLVHLDGYHLPGVLGTALRAAGMPTSTLVDGPFGLHQSADLYVDQNLGAVGAPASELPAGAVMLAGLEFVLLRDQVLDRRGVVATPAPVAVPRLLVVFGGTDPYGGAEAVVDLVVEAGMAVELVVVASRSEVADRLAGRPLPAGVSLELHGAVDDLPGLAVGCDAAVSAAGSSVWELLCLGVPTGVVCVVDNQEVGYRAAADSGVVVPVGRLEALRNQPNERATGREAVVSLLTDVALRQRLQAAGQALVDGAGRGRVADAMERLVRRLGGPKEETGA